MPQDDRDTLDVLKSELNYVQKGGYGRSPREPWRAHLVFEDSPCCMNYDSKADPAPCSECVLMQFVPPEHRGEKIPCRHIRVTPGGATLMDLYRGATDDVIEEAMTYWLQREIAKLESEGQPATL